MVMAEHVAITVIDVGNQGETCSSGRRRSEVMHRAGFVWLILWPGYSQAQTSLIAGAWIFTQVKLTCIPFISKCSGKHGGLSETCF